MLEHGADLGHGVIVVGRPVPSNSRTLHVFHLILRVPIGEHRCGDAIGPMRAGVRPAHQCSTIWPTALSGWKARSGRATCMGPSIGSRSRGRRLWKKLRCWRCPSRHARQQLILAANRPRYNNSRSVSSNLPSFSYSSSRRPHLDQACLESRGGIRGCYISYTLSLSPESDSNPVRPCRIATPDE